jgi:hypothetical protein
MIRRQNTRGMMVVLAGLCFAGYGTLGLPAIGQAVSLSSPQPSVPGADTPGPALKYETDQRVYKRGDVVRITVTNVSDVATPIVDRAAIDGEFAVLETKTDAGEWRPIKLSTAGNLVGFRSLPPGERHEYLLSTSGSDGSKSPIEPGVYRVGFGRPFYTNPFEIAGR